MVGQSDLAAWLAVILFPSTAIAGWILRRYVKGKFVVRLRPHFVLGYAVLALGGIHGLFAMSRMGTLTATNLWFATFAIGGLALQTFVGLNLQAPGSYRAPLRRWHLTIGCIVAALIAAHVALTL